VEPPAADDLSRSIFVNCGRQRTTLARSILGAGALDLRLDPHVESVASLRAMGITEVHATLAGPGIS
jgi:hypothetical protein